MNPNLSDSEIFQTIINFSDRKQSFALAQILNTEGSTPRKIGVKAIIEPSGKIRGTVGGGAVESETQRLARQACKTNQPILFDFHMEGKTAAEHDPICGGKMRILIDPAIVGQKDCYKQAVQVLQERRRGIMLTLIHSDETVKITRQFFAADEIPPKFEFLDADIMQSCLQLQTPQYIERKSAVDEALLEPVIPKPLLLIIGGGHIGQALAHQASLIDFDVTVIDDRTEFTQSNLFPEGVTTRCGDMVQELAAYEGNRDTYIVIVTRGHQYDAETLQACIHKPAAYIGMIGSKRKVALIREKFLTSNLATSDEWERIYTPIGLDIGALTVPEIATSIAAQLIAVRRKGSNNEPPGNRNKH
jgi:xanthine dehydrogenase accessory factor